MERKYFAESHGKLNIVIEEKEKAAATLVFLAGFGTWDSYLTLKNMGNRLNPELNRIYINPLGVAQSEETSAARTLENLVFELHELLEALVKTPLIFFSHSFGGVIALAYAKRYPSQVLGLVGIEPTTRRAEEYFESAAYKKAIAFLTDLSPEEQEKIAYDPEWTENEWAEVQATSSKYEKGATIWRTAANMEQIFTDLEKLPDFQGASLLFYQPFRDEEYRSSEYVGKATQFVALEGNHYLHYCHPELVAQETNLWLEERLQ